MPPFFLCLSEGGFMLNLNLSLSILFFKIFTPRLFKFSFLFSFLASCLQTLPFILGRNPAFFFLSRNSSRFLLLALKFFLLLTRKFFSTFFLIKGASSRLRLLNFGKFI